MARLPVSYQIYFSVEKNCLKNVKDIQKEKRR